MANQELKLKITTEKQGDAISGLKNELNLLAAELTKLKQNNLQLKKDFGAASQEFINGKKKEIGITAELSQKKKDLTELEKQRSQTLKELAVEQKRIAAEEKAAALQAKKDIAEKRKLEIAAAKEKEAEQKRQIAETLKLKQAEEKNISSERRGKLKQLEEPTLLRQLQQEYKLLGAEQLRLIANNERSSTSFEKNKNRLLDLRKEISGLKREMQGLGAETKLSTFQMLEAMENVTVVLFGIHQVATNLKSAVSSSINAGLDYKILRESFQGTTQDLELLRKAVAGTVNDADLINLSNQASTLNIDLEEQARLLSFVETRFDQFRGDVPGGFEKLLKAVQGSTKGLKALKLDTVAYEKTLKDLVKEKGGELEIEQQLNDEKEFTIKNLSFEEANTLRVKAALDVMGVSLEDVKNKQQDSKDKFEAFTVSVDNAKASIGLFLVNGIEKAIDLFGLAEKETVKLTGGIAAMGGQLLTLVPVIAQLKIAFPSLGNSIAGVFGGGGPVVAAIGLTLLWVATLVDKIQDAKREADQLAAYQRKLAQNEFVPIYNPSNAGKDTIDKFKSILEKDPEQDITVDGKTKKLKDYVKELEEAAEKTNQFGKSYSEFTGQVNTKVKEATKSSKELGIQIEKLNEQLSKIKPDDSNLANIKAQRDKLLVEKETVDKLINPPEKQSKSGSPKTPKETYKEENKAVDDLISSLQIEVTLLELKRSTYKDIGEILKVLKDNEGILNTTGVTKQNIAQFYGFEKQLTEKAAEERKKLNKELTDKQLETIQNSLQAEFDAIKDVDFEIAKNKAGLIENEFQQRTKLIEITYEQEIREIQRRGLTERQEKELLNVLEKKHNKEKKELETERLNKVANAQSVLLNSGLQFTEQIVSIFNTSPNNFITKFIAGLREGLGIVNTIKTIVETIKLLGSLSGSGGSGFFNTFFSIIKSFSGGAGGGATAGFINSSSGLSSGFINNFNTSNYINGQAGSPNIVLNLSANLDAISFLKDNVPVYEKFKNKTRSRY